MITHLMKLVKSRLGGSGWILAELLVVFVVLFVMVDYFLAQWDLVRKPIGFKLDDVYVATLAVRPSNSPSFISYEEGSDEPMRNIGRIAEKIGQHADVAAVGLSYYSLPYTPSNIGGSAELDSIRCLVRNYIVSPGYLQVFGIRPIAGGEPEDLGKVLSNAREGQDLIISADLARKLYGRTDAIGSAIHYNGDSITGRVVAVTIPTRSSEFDTRFQHCFFSLLELPVLMERFRLDENSLKQIQITFRIRPGISTADYATRFQREMRQSLSVGNFWVSEVRSYADIRGSFLQNARQTSSRNLISALGLFLLVNVFLAVIGTFWFHVTRRRSELGLRMVVGSTHRGILWLMIGEGLLLLMIAALPALLICANLAFVELLPCGESAYIVPRFLEVSGLTVAILSSVIILATWYPAYKAACLEPSEALRYE